MDEEFEYEDGELSDMSDAENAAEDAWEATEVERLTTVKEAFIEGYKACWFNSK